MQTTQKRQLNLIDPFFDMELDYKNDFVSYITAGIDSNVSVTPKNNNTKKSLDKEYHRGIDNPLMMYCPLFSIQSEDIDNSLFVRSGSSLLMFVDKELDVFSDYLSLYKDFNVFELIEEVA